MSEHVGNFWRVGPGRVLVLDRPRIMAIVNVTPDSFSDGGEHSTPESAAGFALEAVGAGADVLDIGGESTRPGSERVSAAEQIRRVVPAIRAVRRAVGDGPAITIDTTLAEVAGAALDAGADGVNDVSAGTESLEMAGLCAARGCGIVLMHRRAAPGADVYSHQYPREPDYGASGGVVGAVREHLRERAAAVISAGVSREAIMLDPGLGFGKSVGQNLELVARTGEICALGFPVLSGVSRKSFSAAAGGVAAGAPARERVHASVGLSVVHMLAGARVFRVHDVAEHGAALRAAWAARTSGRPGA